ncbi:hypothetical protein GCM10023322_27970 [Rugosimonospora acidiphila]|uniref:Uncharacterized protein n=1 Tax=Rugosimonospora acidiphila TaxID=556531 RepID=A0ABP9RS19_9ACTN
MAIGPDVAIKDPAAAEADANQMAKLATEMHARLEALIGQVTGKLNETDGETKNAFMSQLQQYQKLAMELEARKNNLAAAARSIVQGNVSDDVQFAKAFGGVNP